MDTNHVPTLGSLFDGIGGFPLAAVINGIQPLWASEIEAFPIAVTRHHFPEMLHVGDITKLSGSKLPPVDIICGGSPCQDLSVAGARAGLSGARSGLFIANEKYELIASHTVFPTDLIMSTFISDSIKVCRLPNYIEYAVNKADCVGIRLIDNVNPDFVMFWLSSKEAYNRLAHQIHGATRPRVNTKQIKAIQIPSVKKDVQDKIVSVIQAKFSVCDNIEQTVDTALQQAEAMRQSILKDAFEGRAK